jgi:hypothetical protein
MDDISSLKSEIKNELINYYDGLKFEIDIRIQEILISIDRKLNQKLSLTDQNKLEHVRKDLLKVNIKFIDCVDETCNKNMIEIEKYFQSKLTTFNKEEIKSNALHDYCVFINSDWEPVKENELLQIGHLFKLDWYANTNVCKYLEFLTKSSKFTKYKESFKFDLQEVYF